MRGSFVFLAQTVRTTTSVSLGVVFVKAGKKTNCVAAMLAVKGASNIVDDLKALTDDELEEVCDELDDVTSEICLELQQRKEDIHQQGSLIEEHQEPKIIKLFPEAGNYA